MLLKYNPLLLVPILLINFFPFDSKAACDCGSTDPNNPCTGQTIFVSVTAGTPNGGTAVNSEYTWNFNSDGGDARCGKFANGDYWVAPAVGKSAVTITSITSNGSVSADANPTTESMGLLSGSKDYGNYNASENIIPNLPQSYSSITSIVAAIQRNEAVEGNCGHPGIFGECVDSYNILTILPTVPALAGSETIRPNITGESKELLDFSNFDFNRLPNKSFLVGTNTEGFEVIRRRWSHSTEIFGLRNSAGKVGGYCSEGGMAFRSHILIDDFGAGVSATHSNDLMIMFSDDNSFAEKKQALAAMLTYGLDLYHAMYDAPTGYRRYWGTGGAQHPGKFLPPVFFAALARDSKYATNLKTAAAHAHDYPWSGPHELGQIHQGHNGIIWGDETGFTGTQYLGAYWDSLWKSQCYDGALGTCTPIYGEKTQVDPHRYIDGPPNKPGSGYLGNTIGPQRSMVAAMYLIPEVCEIVNYDGLISYVDRIGNEGIKSSNDPCVTPDSREVIGGSCTPYTNSGCKYYGVTWGPITPTDPKSSCITTATPPYTKVGRFTSVDGTSVGYTYTSGQVEKNWQMIRGTKSSCRDSITIPTDFREIQ